LGGGIIIFVQKKLDVLQLHIAGGQCEALQWLAHIPDDRLAVDSVIALIWLHNATTHVLHFDGEVFLMYAPHGRQSLVFCAQHSRHNVLKEQTEQQGVCLAVLNQALYFESLRSCKWMTTANPFSCFFIGYRWDTPGSSPGRSIEFLKKNEVTNNDRACLSCCGR